MSKQEKPKPEKPDTETALANSKKAAEKKAAEVTTLESKFEAEQSPQAWDRLNSAKAEYAYLVRICDICQAAHDAALKAEQDRIAAEAEAKRLAALAENEKAVEENQRRANAATVELAKAYARSWELAIEAQSFGGSGLNAFNSAASASLMSELIAVGIGPSALRLV